MARNTCRVRAAPAKGAAATFDMTTRATPEQERALKLVGEIGTEGRL